MIVFDAFYEGYDEWYTTPAGAFVDAVETGALFGLLSPRRGMKVLDVGCGTGNVSMKLAGLGCDVTGVDISENMLAAARRKPRPGESGIRFETMDATRLSFADNTFDAVVSAAAFEFVGAYRQAYREMRRVVKPGGAVVIGTIQKGGAWERLYSSSACAGTAYAHARFKTKEQLQALEPTALCGTQECLYLPPGLPEDAYTPQAEAAAQQKESVGGFVCVKFQKKA